MRKIYFLFPKMTLSAGGHFAQLSLLENVRSICDAEAVTYEAREINLTFLDDLLSDDKSSEQDAIFFVHWGHHVPQLIDKLKHKQIVYCAYSTGYGFTIPPGIPILAGSKHTQAYWGRYAPSSPIFYLPCEILPQFTNRHLARDIEVLVQKRKSSQYILNELVPALQKHCSVTVLDKWVDDLAEIFNRSKIYLYDSTEHWAYHGVSEGFGLPPLEALACGCTVFSSLNDALSDYLSPEEYGHQLRVYSKEYDIERILRSLAAWKDENSPPIFLEDYRQENLQKQLAVITKGLNEFFDHKRLHPTTISPVGLLPPELEIKNLREELHKIQSSRSWRWLEAPRKLYAGWRRLLKRDSQASGNT